MVGEDLGKVNIWTGPRKNKGKTAVAPKVASSNIVARTENKKDAPARQRHGKDAEGRLWVLYGLFSHKCPVRKTRTKIPS